MGLKLEHEPGSLVKLQPAGPTYNRICDSRGLREGREAQGVNVENHVPQTGRFLEICK